MARRLDAERRRLEEARTKGVTWRRWGPYLSERQWGTVREDYSADGSAWDYFPHDHARSRAYHWGEDGLAGISDDRQRLCFALALWNGKDPILKERLFGLTNGEGNHGEDVKEAYYYLDNLPSHAYMRWLYRYPHRAYPYEDLVRTNRARSRTEPEYEIVDTGVFDDRRFFDVTVEYAKADPEDLLVRVTVENRGSEEATIHLLPTLWFRNTWTWWPDSKRPSLRAADAPEGARLVVAEHPDLGRRFLWCEGDADLLFTENETNLARVVGTPNPSPWVKDAFDAYVVHGRRDAVNPERRGTKAAAHAVLRVPAGGAATMRLRLSEGEHPAPFAAAFDRTVAVRKEEADAFYASLTPKGATEDEARVLRQAMAGMLWSKQYYHLEAHKWLEEHGAHPTAVRPRPSRNRDWYHLVNEDVVLMPDKWEYPWYAAWDLAFHAIAVAAVDLDLAKEQVELVLRETHLHPSGQIPAYEWNYSDVNPPVQAWAAIYVYRLEQAFHGKGDLAFLARVFRKLMLNFTWWVNRKDRTGKNVFEGGFLGLDNIGVFDRSAPLPTGGHLEQADGTAWMAFFCQNMFEMAIELASHDPSYEDMCVKFVEHFLWIGAAIHRPGSEGLWDEEDGFYYDLLRRPDGTSTRLKVRSIVGLLPLCAATRIDAAQRQRIPAALERIRERVRQMPHLADGIYVGDESKPGVAGRTLIGLVREDRLRRVLRTMLDEKEFLGPYGLRALSRYHAEHPYEFRAEGQTWKVEYCPAESDSGLFGGNSNWRGPVWFPMNMLVIRALIHYHQVFGADWKVECPTGSGRWMDLYEVARELGRRLISIFLRDPAGRRPVFGGSRLYQEDPLWRDHLLFYEYFHGDNGAGVGASHQTGWTGCVGLLIQLFGWTDSASMLESGTLRGSAPTWE